MPSSEEMPDTSERLAPHNAFSLTLLVLFALACTLVSGCSGLSEPPASASAAPAASYEAERKAMVRLQIRARGVRDARVLEAMENIPRHLFVPESLTRQAYEDHPLPIGAGQTISQPYIVAFMSELLDVEPHHKVLEIGTGSAYQAAVLSRLAERVYSIEIVESLGEQARRRLDELGYRNVEVLIGNGYLGWPENAPFDRIILTAAPEEVPQALVDQLAAPGRLVAPVGPSSWSQDLIVIDKDAAGKTRGRTVLPVRFVPMVDKPKQR